VEAATESRRAEPPRRRPTARATDVQSGGAPAYLAELIGTFTLVFFVCMIFVVNSGDGIGVTDFAVIGLVHAFVLMMLVYGFGGTSGAHFNPAVTIALLVGRKIRPPDAVIYIVVQLLGGLLAALLVKLLVKDEGAAVNYGATTIAEAPEAPAPQPGVPPPTDTGPGWLDGKPLGGVVVEAIGTFFLMYAIMAVAVNPRGNRTIAGWVIGATLGMGVMTLAPLTGAGFNPARSFGPAIAAGEWGDFWVYVVGPIVGAVLAFAVYTAVVLSPQAREPQPPEVILD
jgi:MIP family channel proteins